MHTLVCPKSDRYYRVLIPPQCLFVTRLPNLHAASLLSVPSDFALEKDSILVRIELPVKREVLNLE